MNKSLITHSVAAGLMAGGVLTESAMILNIGLFAVAGSVTNWLAVHMLFEKVPGLYGSGVISARFEDFKLGINSLVMEQFFSKENLDRFFDDMVTEDQQRQLDLHDVIDKTDLSPAFEGLVSSIMASSFGSMLGMFGGVEALTPLKEPFIDKMKEAINDIAHSDSFQTSVKEKLGSDSVSDELHQKIERVVVARLDELTPEMVKDIIQTMIKKHLGWLVVWGGVFGGLIGLLSSQLPLLI